MITADLPAGYLRARGLRMSRGAPFAAVLPAAVFPNFDPVRFFVADGGGAHHHRYWVHFPAFWTLIALVTLPLLRLLAPAVAGLAVLFLAGIALHILLDSIAGDFLWLWPVSDRMFPLTAVPAGNHDDLIAFLTHWTFLLQLPIWAAAPMRLTRARGARR